MMPRDKKLALIFMCVWFIFMVIFVWCALGFIEFIYEASKALPVFYDEFEDIAGGIL